jgi:hypothetical protein
MIGEGMNHRGLAIGCPVSSFMRRQLHSQWKARPRFTKYFVLCMDVTAAYVTWRLPSSTQRNLLARPNTAILSISTELLEIRSRNGYRVGGS